MTRRQLVEAACERLKENGVRKTVSVPKHVFHISDDEGNEHDFTVKQVGKTVMYTIDDVMAILNTCIEVTMDALKRGETVMIHGFGGLTLRYRKPSITHSVYSNEFVEVPGKYIPKLIPGNGLRMCGVAYSMSLGDVLPENMVEYDDLEDDEEELDEADETMDEEMDEEDDAAESFSIEVDGDDDGR